MSVSLPALLLLLFSYSVLPCPPASSFIAPLVHDMEGLSDDLDEEASPHLLPPVSMIDIAAQRPATETDGTLGGGGVGGGC